MFGPNFGNELVEAGLEDLPISWSASGELIGTEDLTDEQSDALEAVIAAHDPDKPFQFQMTRVYKADVWRRATDAEAAQIDALLKAQPVRLQRLWDDAQFLLTTDELFASVQAGAVSLFGAERAAELLQPTE